MNKPVLTPRAALRNIASICAIALTAAMATPAAACDLIPDSWASLIGSKHFDAQEDYNERNAGLFLGWDCKYVSTRIGAYDNSLYRRSTAVTFTSDYLSVGLAGSELHPFVGTAKYPDTGRNQINSIWGDWTLIGGVELTHEDVPLFVQWLPGDEEAAGYSSIAAFGVRLDF